MERKVNHLRDDLRRTFTLYALIPIFIMSLLTAGLAVAYWNTNVVERNQKRLASIGDFMETLIAGSMRETDALAGECDVATLRQNQAVRVEMYQKLYAYANRAEIYAGFFLLDKNQQIVLSSNSQEPDFLPMTKDLSWGIVQRIEKSPASPVYEFMGNVKSFSQPMDIAVGKAILKDGVIDGYLVLIISGARLLDGMENPYVHIIVKDRFDYVPICTDRVFSTQMNKLQEGFRSAAGYVSLAGNQYYVTKRGILNDDLTIYAVADVGQMIEQFAYAIFILLGVLIVLSVTVIISVKHQAVEKTKMMDQLVAAFEAVRAGDLNQRLAITTNNEFQIIGDAYNMMLASLRNLIQNNKEKARETVISEIKQLESQFNPHFLFNTLENIKFMIKLDPNAAGKMILALSGLLRYSINNTANRVTLQEDMQYIQNYLDIQKYRFGNRLNYVLSVPEAVNACIVPKLIIQPIVENAIKYGMKDCEHLVIEMKVFVQASVLRIMISNNGSVIEPETLCEIQQMLASKKNDSQHSGLYNVNRRIHLMYGEAYGISLISQATGTTVSLALPYEKAGE